MKNILLKSSLGIIATFLFIGGIVFVNAQNNNIPPEEHIMPIYYNYSQNTNDMGDFYKDKINKNNNMINNYFLNFMPMVAGLGTIFTIILLALVAFWVWMLVHAIRKDIDYKPVWILVLWFLNIFGAIIYYFAVKRTYIEYSDFENTCVCGPDGECVCGNVEENKKEITCVCNPDGECVCGNVEENKKEITCVCNPDGECVCEAKNTKN